MCLAGRINRTTGSVLGGCVCTQTSMKATRLDKLMMGSWQMKSRAAVNREDALGTVVVSLDKHYVAGEHRGHVELARPTLGGPCQAADSLHWQAESLPHISRFLTACLLFVLAFSLCLGSRAGEKVHGTSVFGPSSLKYREGEPFEYLNPQAPIAGTLRLPGEYYTKLSPFGLTGKTAPGMGLCFESLGIKSWDDDEPFAVYGLLAKYFEIAGDKTSMTIYLRPEACFSDGRPVTADDVVFSYELLYDPDVNPAEKILWKGVDRMVKIDRHTVKIFFSKYRRDLPVWVPYLVVYPKHVYGAPGKNLGKDFNDALPVGSGPYVVESHVRGQSITYVRRDDYWGKDVPYCKGYVNWRRIEFQIFYDDFSKIEALKSGGLDYLCWLPRDVVHGLGGDYFEKNYIVHETFPLTRPAAMKCLIFNLRKPMFQDKELRKVIISLYDFDYVNKNFYFNEDERIVSYFNNQRHLRASPGPARGRVREMLEKLARKHNKPEDGTIYVPREALTRGPYELGTDADGKRFPITQRIAAASRRLDDLGWVWDPSAGVRVRNGKPLAFEILESSQEIFHYTEVLKRAGIKAVQAKLSQLERQNRTKNAQFDLMGSWFDGRKLPGRELARNFLSDEADVKGSANTMGLKNPAVDEVLQMLVVAESPENVEVCSKVFDRIMCANWYVVPLTWPTVDHAVYWNYLRGPKIHAPGLWAYYPIRWYWWFDEDRYKRIQEAIQKGVPFEE